MSNEKQSDRDIDVISDCILRRTAVVFLFRLQITENLLPQETCDTIFYELSRVCLLDGCAQERIDFDVSTFGVLSSPFECFKPGPRSVHVQSCHLTVNCFLERGRVAFL